jgi:arabinose-5-phosphate isomerase
VSQQSSLPEALVVVSKKGFGMTAVIDENRNLAGIFTDGDLRRSIDRHIDINRAKISDVMSTKPKTVHKEMLAAEALGIMEEKKITALVVVDNHQPVGIVHMHDILRAGVV